jgi:hypothetical protein
MSTSVPFVVGQWVRGPQFYGRAAELAAALDPRRRWLWVCGLRRVGKTSLLRELELRAARGETVPLLWDLQGVEDASELGQSWAGALEEAEEVLETHGVVPASIVPAGTMQGELERGVLLGCVERLLRALGRRGARLLLLIDEGDQLGRLALAAPELVSALWRALAAGEARVVVATSLRFGEAATDPATAALCAELGPPLYLGALRDLEARALLLQDHLAEGVRPCFDAATVELLCRASGNHPMLLQLLGRRCLELRDARGAVAQVAAERTLDHLFAVDLDLLAPGERAALRAAAREGLVDSATAEQPSRYRLRALGLLRPRGDGHLALASTLLADWLRASDPQPPHPALS